MAKILVSFPGEKINNNFYFYAFYEGLINSLKRNGNEVYYMIANEFIENYSARTNDIRKDLNTVALDAYLRKINPDLIISFNNFRYKNLHNVLECPFIVWGVDSVPFFSDKETLKKYASRYRFFANNEEDIPAIKEFFNPSSVALVRFATDIRNDNMEQNKNITFIGYYWDNVLRRLLEQQKLTVEQVSIIEKCYRSDVQSDIKKVFELSNIPNNFLLKQTEIMHSISSTDRETVLLNLSDLDLHLYGQRWQYAQYNLANKFKNEPTYSIQILSEILNSSKICFNMSHIQATKMGFSFRLLDGMASNACLVTDFKEGYKKLFGQYVDLPTFEYGNPQDARKVCEYLLNHEDERKEIVKASNKAIEAEFRFEHRFKQIEEIVNVSLLNDSEGSIKRIKADDFIQKEEKENKKTLNFSFMPKQKKEKKNFFEKIKNHPMRKQARLFRLAYDKYFSSPINRILKQNAYTILPNPSLYDEKAYFESYIAKVSKGLPLKKEGEKIRIIFLFQEASYWASIKTLYEKLKADDRFEVFVIAIPVLTVPHLDTFEIKDKHIEFLKENNIDYIDGRIVGQKCFDPFYLKPDYVFTQIHFDIQRSLEYKSNILGLYTKVCLVPHAFLLSASDNSELIYQQNYFRIFAPNEEHKNILKSVIHRDDNIEVTGYPRFDLYKEKIEDCPIWNISKKENPNIKRIIWSPHWWAYGSTQELADKIFEFWAYFYNLAKENKDIEVIIKPHPNLLNGIVGNGFATEEEVEFLVKKLDELDNISMYTGGEYFDLFKTADLMVNNSISFLAEWLPSNKPMIFIDTERKFELNETAEKILNVYYHIDNINDLNNQINNLLFKEQDYLKEKRCLLAEEFLPTEKDAADKIIESLIKHVND